MIIKTKTKKTKKDKKKTKRQRGNKKSLILLCYGSFFFQGGPGGSSLFGLFVENGPFSVTGSRFATVHTFSDQFSFFDLLRKSGTGGEDNFLGSHTQSDLH